MAEGRPSFMPSMIHHPQRWLVRLTFLAMMLALGVQAHSVHAQSGESTASGAPEATSDEKLRALIDVLQDEQARTTLVDELQAALDEETLPAEAEAAASPKALVRQAAEMTQRAAEDLSTLSGRVIADLRGLQDLFAGGARLDLAGLIERNLGLIGVIATTCLVLLASRRLLRPVFWNIARRAGRSGWLASGLWLIASFLLDALPVLFAYAVGQGMALGIFGEPGQISLHQSLYLNAFLLVELVKALLRALIMPRHASLRLLPVSDPSAAFAYRRSASIASLLGYGLMVATPIVTSQITVAVGRASGVLFMLIALVLALFGIWRLKGRLARDARQNGQTDDLTGQVLSVIQRLWPWLATLYVIGVFLIAVSRPVEVLPFVLGATGRSILYVALGVALATLLGRTIQHGVPLPSRVRADLPLLGQRLHRALPMMLRVIRFAVMILVTVLVIDAWSLVDLSSWLGSSYGEALAAALLSTAFILLAAYLIWLAFMSWIEYRLSDSVGRIAGARERTLLSLLSNAFTIVVVTIVSMLTLSELGINIGPLLAGAGVLGLAIGFGAQTMVRDIITGVFIQFENAINTGDVVTVAGVTGTVERLSVRSVGLRDLAGTYHLIPFSAVDTVANFNRGFAYHVAEIGIAYKESVGDAKAAMAEAFKRLQAGELGAGIVGDLEMQGVTALGDSSVVVRARVKTLPGRQWAIGRAYNELLKDVFDEHGIEIPFPHMTMFWGTDKAGKTQLAGVSAPAGAETS
jgi:small conductance mechanosensitive channel